MSEVRSQRTDDRKLTRITDSPNKRAWEVGSFIFGFRTWDFRLGIRFSRITANGLRYTAHGERETKDERVKGI